MTCLARWCGGGFQEYLGGAAAGSGRVEPFHIKINGTTATIGIYLDGSAIPALSSTSANLELRCVNDLVQFLG